MAVQADNSHIQDATPEKFWVEGQPGLHSLTLFYFIFFKQKILTNAILIWKKRKINKRLEYSIWSPNRLNLFEICQVYFSSLLETEMNTNLFCAVLFSK